MAPVQFSFSLGVQWFGRFRFPVRTVAVALGKGLSLHFSALREKGAVPVPVLVPE